VRGGDDLMAYSKPSLNCLQHAADSAGGDITNADILDAFDEVNRYKAELEAKGLLTGNAERLRKFSAEKAEKAKIAAAMQKRMAALNVIRRKEIDAHISGLRAQGMSPAQALLAMFEGAGGKFTGVAGGRKSVWSRQQGARKRYQGRWIEEALTERPHLRPLLASRDKAFDRDVTIEMWELRDGGQPGKTGNEDAKWFAAHTAKYLELARTEVNRAGNAGIGKLDGYAGAQTHDDIKLIRAGKINWINRIMVRLDKRRTFSEGVSDAEAEAILGDIYDTIITGLPNTPTPAELGQRVGPANLARSLAKHRVLHFKSADDAMAYNEEFGYGGTISGIASQLGNMGNVLGLVESLGGNPETMVKAVAASLDRQVKEDATLDPATKAKWSKQLDLSRGSGLAGALDIMVGMTSRPTGDGRWATIGENVRSVERMAKLGGATITSVPSDAVLTALAAQFRGGSFLKTLTGHIGALMRGRPRDEQMALAYLGGEGYDGLISAMMGGRVANDATTGAIAKAQDIFFRVNGLTGTTDIARAFNVRMIQAELGMNARHAYGDLYGNYRHVLGMHGIDAARWDVLRQAVGTVEGKPYITPDRVRDLSDEAFMPLVQDRLTAIAGQRDFAERAAGIVGDARRSLELDLHAFFADEVSYGVVTPDAAATRWTTWGGTRPGTRAGELARYTMQFKATPIAFIQRPLARLAYGRSWKDIKTWQHLGTGLVGLMIAGYISMTFKDVLKGYWPPRDPTDPRTIMAAVSQSGALGIYGDFLFSQNNRFGGGVLETVAGPTFGSISDIISAGLDARDYAISGGEDKFSGTRAFNAIYGNTPYANLFYTQPVMNYLWVESLREYLGPGYQRRQERDRIRQYGQERMDFLPPRTLAQTLDR
jgi:hypothetical protein